MDVVGVQTMGDITGSGDEISKNACVTNDDKYYAVTIKKTNIIMLLLFYMLVTSMLRFTPDDHLDLLPGLFCLNI